MEILAELRAIEQEILQGDEELRGLLAMSHPHLTQRPAKKHSNDRLRRTRRHRSGGRIFWAEGGSWATVVNFVTQCRPTAFGFQAVLCCGSTRHPKHRRIGVVVVIRQTTIEYAAAKAPS